MTTGKKLAVVCVVIAVAATSTYGRTNLNSVAATSTGGSTTPNSATVVKFDDLAEQIAVTIDGVAISNGGRVSNLVLNGESVSFDLLVNGTTNVVTQTCFTRLLDPGSSDDNRGTVSDIFLMSFVNGQATYHVVFGSDPELPPIPDGAIDLTTIGAQGLPPNPYYEDGTFQKVGTAFFSDGSSDTFFVRSDVPEPVSLILLAAGAAALATGRRKVGLVRGRHHLRYVP